ncbi:MAG: molybdopterin molybdotransferase MoeA [Pirellulaceae bacterium]
MVPALAMITPDQALRMVLKVAEPLTPRSVAVSMATGLRVAEDVYADRDYPPFDRAMMDGYAVRPTGDAPLATVRIVGRIAAGQAGSTRLEPGQCVEIMTGAECPPGTHAIVPVEEAVREGEFLRLPETVRTSQHMALRGSECRRRSILLRPGDLMSPVAIGVLASIGRRDLRVVPAPTLGIITTGEELIADDQLPESAQIRDSNGPMLAAMASTWGIPSVCRLHARDECDAIVAALAATKECDIVVLTGGVSMGRYDLVPDAIRSIHGEILFHKVRQKPGKPMLFARHGCRLVFGLPGNPLAAHLCFHRYVSAAIRRLGGHPAPATRHGAGTLLTPIQPNSSRASFVLGRAIRNSQREGEGDWNLQPLPGKSSADLFGSSHANCYIQVPPGDEVSEIGDMLPFEWLADAWRELS